MFGFSEARMMLFIGQMEYISIDELLAFKTSLVIVQIASSWHMCFPRERDRKMKSNYLEKRARLVYFLIHVSMLTRFCKLR